VLLVNDDPDGLYLFERAVAREFPDSVIFKCNSAPSALTFLHAQKVEAVMTDNRMLEMTGLAMVAAIRKFDPKTPILMVTGAGNIEAEAMAAGVTLFIANGKWDEIRAKIRQLVTEAP
jgi:DNA-binding NtrC family response regulator